MGLDLSFPAIILQIYAGSFFAIPLFRWFIVLKTNADIEKRNQARQQCARALESPDLSLRRKVCIGASLEFVSLLQLVSLLSQNSHVCFFTPSLLGRCV